MQEYKHHAAREYQNEGELLGLISKLSKRFWMMAHHLEQTCNPTRSADVHVGREIID